MKVMTRIFIMVSLALLACETQDENPKPISESIEMIFESQHFKGLNVSPSLLQLDEEPTQQLSKIGRALVVNFKSRKSYQKIIGFFNKKNEVINVMLVNVRDVNHAEDVSNSIRNGSFNGKLILQTSGVTHSIKFLKSKPIRFETPVISAYVDPMSPGAVGGGMSGGCADMRAVYQCIAETMVSMGPFSYAACLIDLPVCMAICAADCMYYGCPPGGASSAS